MTGNFSFLLIHSQSACHLRLMEDKMKKILLCLFLVGCGNDVPVYHEVAQNGIDVINAIEQGLPAECKTETNKTLFSVARKEMSNVEHSCDLQIAKVEQEKLRWKWSLFALLAVIGVYIVRKVLK